jgi:hypothetical protein
MIPVRRRSDYHWYRCSTPSQRRVRFPLYTLFSQQDSWSHRVLGKQRFSASPIYGNNLSAGQYRELGVLLWRGWGIDAAMAQCFGNEQDMASKGRQMPVVLSFSFLKRRISILIADECSTGVLRNTTSTRSRPLWPHRSLKQLALLMPSDVIQHEEAKTVLQFILGKGQRLRATFMRACYLHLLSHRQPSSLRAITALPYQRRPQSSILVTG